MWFKNNKNNTLKIIENKDNSKNKSKIKKGNNNNIDNKIDNSITNFNFILPNFEISNEQKNEIEKINSEINEGILNGEMPLNTLQKYNELFLNSMINGKNFEETKKICNVHLEVSKNEKIKKTERELITEKLLNSIKDDEKWKEEIIIESYNNFLKNNIIENNSKMFLRFIELIDDIESKNELNEIIIPYLQMQVIKLLMIKNKQISKKEFDVLNNVIFSKQKLLFQNEDSKNLIIKLNVSNILKRLNLYSSSSFENTYVYFDEAKDLNMSFLNTVVSGPANDMILILQHTQKFRSKLNETYNHLNNMEYIVNK